MPEVVTLRETSCGVATVAVAGSSAQATAIMGGADATELFPGGPLGGSALGFTGTSGFLSTTGGSTTSPATYTELAWFKSNPGSSGPLLGFSDANPLSGATLDDRQLWIDANGYLVAGIDAGSGVEVASTSTVTDGSWHLAAVTFSGSELDLYVDGALVASNTSVVGPSSYSGWWTVGAAAFVAPSWSDPPAGTGGVSYFAGSISGVAVLPAALDANEVADLAGAGSFSSYTTLVNAQSPLETWMLQDSAPIIEASLPGYSFSDLCDLSLVTVSYTAGGSVTCLFPAGPVGSSCPSADSGEALGDLASIPATAPAPLLARADASLEVSVGTSSSAPAALAGADVIANLDVTATGAAWSVHVDFPMSETTL